MRLWLLLSLVAACAGPRPLAELLTFARAQDGEGISSVSALLKDGEPVERAHAAFALGQLGVAWEPVEEGVRAAAERALVEQGARESEAPVRDRIVEALGKVGGAGAIPFLTRALDGPERARAAVALGLLFKNGRIHEPAAVPRLVALLDDADAEARWAAAYALFRMKAAGAVTALLAHLSDPSWLVRATCARALGELGAGGDAFVSLIDDPDERVAAEAGRTLAKSAAACAPEAECPALALLGRSGAWRPAVAAAISAEPVTHPAAAQLFGARAGGDCGLALAHDRALGRTELTARCDGDERRRKVLAARALGEARISDPAADSARRHALAALYDHPEAAVRAQVSESLGKLTSHALDELVAQHLADENDPAALTATAEAVVAHKISGVELTVMRKLGALSQSRAADAVETVLALEEAAGALGVRESIPILLQLAQDASPPVRSAAKKALLALGQPAPAPLRQKVALAAPRAESRVRLETTHGPIVLLLWSKDAPRTTENFLKLVRAHFYDRLTFHRVVPDFVAQGGDPRGDGSGGPGWMIDCEINQRRYREGTVGMALSGRDTGGSQFFVALSPQPHLDGRYTAFGEVVEGMAAARALVEGDRILSASLLE